MSGVFDTYAAYYNLLYRDKDYAGETNYLHKLIQTHASGANSLLELGCGTGAHATQFARKGYTVHGIDISESMLESAGKMKAALPPELADRIHFEHGDVRDWRGKKTFDVVLSLFHVFSYQISDAAIRAAFRTAREHLRPGGLLLLDFWYGPAVLAIGPEKRMLKLSDDTVKVTRHATPKSFPDLNRVDVHYDVLVEGLATGESSRFEETHAMRYLFPTEIDNWLAEVGLTPIAYREWMADREPSAKSWGALLMAQLPHNSAQA